MNPDSFKENKGCPPRLGRGHLIPHLHANRLQLTVVPGFKIIGPSTANPGNALNPGTILLSYMEIVNKPKVDLNNPIF